MMGGCQPNLTAPHQGSPLQYARGSCERVGTTQGRRPPYGKMACLVPVAHARCSPLAFLLILRRWPGAGYLDTPTGHLRAQCFALCAQVVWMDLTVRLAI